MNIFATYNCPVKSAKYLDNKRVIKMILESAQMLSGALRSCGCNKDELYKLTHINHPCSIWTRSSKDNYKWLLNHFIALCNEYTKRYGKIHKCWNKYPIFKDNMELLPDGPLMRFENCTTLKDVTDTNLAYRLYLRQKWQSDKVTPKWRK